MLKVMANHSKTRIRRAIIAAGNMEKPNAAMYAVDVLRGEYFLSKTYLDGQTLFETSIWYTLFLW